MLDRRMLRTAAAALLALALWPWAGEGRAPGQLSEAGGWLQGYLRLNTSNPPGNEQIAAAYLAGILAREGIPSRRWLSPAGRVSLSARLSSPASGGRAVLLLHHMDVVAPGPGWTVAPFAGLVQDGRLWGRGALDDKSLGIVELAAMVDLVRRRARLERDVLLLAVPDEENGGKEGTEWLLDRHPELFSGVEAVVGEGGRSQVAGDKLLWWGIEVAQKRPLWLEVTASGRGGHASGLNPESANHQLIAGLARLLALPVHWRVSAPARAYLAAVAPLHNAHWRAVFSHIDQVIDEQRGPRQFLLPGMANLFLDTVQVTVVAGGERINVIPTEASARIDIRLLPDTDAAAFLAAARAALGPELAVKVLVSAPPAAASPTAGRFYDALRQTLGREAPLAPTLVPGFTDSRFFRQRQVPAYGISPFALAPDDVRGIHGADERIPLAELDHGARRMIDLLSIYVGAGVPTRSRPHVR
ncbi:MAG TPA: M20/M25/M40 family metallo-hydrolase [Thermoanaerobaculia bacterium]|nr:M20/M25/M40 family metallo-hydrolase [Thermoanaerobaculia bacterium]